MVSRKVKAWGMSMTHEEYESEVARRGEEFLRRSNSEAHAREWLTAHVRAQYAHPWLAPVGSVHGMINIGRLAEMIDAGDIERASLYIRSILAVIDGVDE